MEFKEIQNKILERAERLGLFEEKTEEDMFFTFIKSSIELKKELDIYLGMLDFIYMNSKKEREYINKLKTEERYNLKLELGKTLSNLIILTEKLGIDLVDCLEKSYNDELTKDFKNIEKATAKIIGYETEQINISKEDLIDIMKWQNLKIKEMEEYIDDEVNRVKTIY